MPTLVSALSAHAKLAQQTLDAEVLHESLSHLLRCRTEFDALNGLVNEGRLPEAVQSLEGLDRALSGAPVALAQSEAMVDMKVNQLLRTFTRRICFNDETATIQSSKGPRRGTAQ